MTSESTFGDVLSEVKAALAAGDHDRAIALTDDLLASYPDAISVWRLRAEAFSASGRPFQASEAYQRVLDIAPADADTMARLALALSASGQHAEAKLAARQALDYEPADEALLRILASPGAEDADLLDMGAHLREGLSDVRAGLLDRGIARLNYVAAQRPDRPDVLVVLAHALWQAGSRVAAAEVCQAILDVQPDCLNAHALLLALWRQIGPSGLEQAHLRAIERLDPDHSHVKALLGDASPLEVVSVPARRPPSPQPPAQEAEALDRADWVDDLVAAASSAPKPLERIAPQVFPADLAHPLESDDALIAAASSGDAGTEVAGNDVVHLDDVSAAGDEAIPAESLIPLEWEEAEDLLDEGGEAAPAWLPDQPGGFAPARPQRPTPDAADGVPAHIEPLEWEAGEQPVGEAEAAAPVAESKPRAPRRGVPGGPPGAASVVATAAGKAAAAREAINQSRWQEAVKLYEKAIASSRGKALDEIIADLEAMRAAQPATRAVHELLGMAYARKGDVDAALDAYHRAMALAADA
ncbi:MAG: tetratricopeptide repeat protein [Anaerolineae bacterium]|nr:tetratricopeptide repeat protein [Candidatus Roseilinea sp.]MDW8450488.1 tetratricopeptide repeat protein [Anaerolineae bacterium]